MNARKFLVFVLAANLAIAAAVDWCIGQRAVVILSSCALLALIARKAITGKG